MQKRGQLLRRPERGLILAGGGGLTMLTLARFRGVLDESFCSDRWLDFDARWVSSDARNKSWLITGRYCGVVASIIGRYLWAQFGNGGDDIALEERRYSFNPLLTS